MQERQSVSSSQGGQIFSDSRKPFAKIFIFEDIFIFGHKKTKTPDFKKTEFTKEL